MSFRSLSIALLAMLAAVLGLHFAALAHYPKEQLDPFRLSEFYPLSVFVFRTPKPYQLGVTLALAVGFAWAWPRLAREQVRLGWLVVAGLAFAVLSNLQHGVRFGLDFPTATSGGSGIEYYHEPPPQPVTARQRQRAARASRSHAARRVRPLSTALAKQKSVSVRTVKPESTVESSTENVRSQPGR